MARTSAGPISARGTDRFVAALAPMPDVELHELMVLRHERPGRHNMVATLCSVRVRPGELRIDDGMEQCAPLGRPGWMDGFRTDRDRARVVRWPAAHRRDPRRRSAPLT